MNILKLLFGNQDQHESHGEESLLERSVSTVVGTGKCDIRFSSLPPLPTNGIYFKDGETTRYWVDIEYEIPGKKSFTERHYMKYQPDVEAGQKVTASYVPGKGIVINPLSENQEY